MHEQIEHLVDSLEHSAEWRLDVSQRFPDDADRNLSASRELVEQSRLLRNYKGSAELELYLAALEVDDGYPVCERQQEVLSSIWFCARSAEDFLLELAEAALGDLDASQKPVQ